MRAAVNFGFWYVISTRDSLHFSIHEQPRTPKGPERPGEKEERGKGERSIHVASLRLQISRNCLISETSLGIVAVTGEVESRKEEGFGN